MDTASLNDPVEPLYDARLRGSVFISTVLENRVHLHGGCWVAPAGPGWMMVAFPKEFEGADLVRQSGIFTLSLVAADDRSYQDQFFLGDQAISARNHAEFLRAPSGSPVLRRAVAYLDIQGARYWDLGDFILAAGPVTAAQALRPEARNLTVNEIIASADPRGVQDDTLPFKGFDFSTASLDPAPAERNPTADLISTIYQHRAWGPFWVAAEEGSILTADVMQCSHRPPSMAIAVQSTTPASAEITNLGGRFSLTIATSDTFIPQLVKRLPVARDGVAYFLCETRQTHHLAKAQLVVAEVTDWGWLNRPNDRDG